MTMAGKKRDVRGRYLEQDYDVSWVKSRSCVDANTGCWNWSGVLTNTGYGQTAYRNKTILAHRMAFLIANGRLPKVVMHSCDNRKCVNPLHLFAGNQKKNLQDMVDKGRAGETVYRRQIPDDIRDAIRDADMSQSQLARIYGVDQSTVSRIINRKDTNRTRYGGG